MAIIPWSLIIMTIIVNIYSIITMCYYIYTQIHTRSYYLTLLTMLDIPKLLSSKHSEEKKNLIKWRKKTHPLIYSICKN